MPEKIHLMLSEGRHTTRLKRNSQIRGCTKTIVTHCKSPNWRQTRTTIGWLVREAVSCSFHYICTFSSWKWYDHWFFKRTTQFFTFFFSKSGYFLAIYGHFQHFVFQFFSNRQQQWTESQYTQGALPWLPSCQLGGGGRQQFRNF